MIAEQIRFGDVQVSDGEPASGDSFWRAVEARDASRDGEFVYAVLSTGVYCKPSCPSRRPRREQVAFFSVPQAAEEAGFRACKRCRPDGGQGADHNAEVVRRVCRYIEENYTGERSVTLEALGNEVGVSPFHLQRIFKRATGITPRQYAEALRLGQLKAGLKEGDSVTGAMYSAGYNSGSRLYSDAPAHLGMTPGEYKRGGPSVNIAYSIANCSLGSLLVAATERGVCAVRFGDEEATLQKALQVEFPSANLSRDEAVLGEWVSAILRHLEGRQPHLPHLDLPLDVRATAFQKRVWEALRAIPYGATRSYSQVAQAIGDANATRAVAQACVANPVALVVPCHRVVRAGGEPGGYRWGEWRKRSLLAREQATASSSGVTGVSLTDDTASL